MKKLLTLFAAIAMLFVACSKDDEGGNSLNPLPPMTDPEDVCTAMECIEFMRYCYDNFDVNDDGKVSPTEALGVTQMKFREYSSKESYYYEVTSLVGIEYFSNLKSLDCRDCHELGTAPIQSLTNLRDVVFVNCFPLQKIEFPDGLPEIYLYDSYALTYLKIPASVTKITCEVCGSLSVVHSLATTPPSAYSSLFSGSSIEQIRVPFESVEDYKSAEGWNKYADYIYGY